MDAPWMHLVLAVLATWRLSVLLARDDGPWDAIARLREALGDGQWGRLLDCFHCVSLWVAAPLAWAIGRDALEVGLAWPALSGAACLIERWQRPPAPVLTIEPWDEQGDHDELLRNETIEPGGSKAPPGDGNVTPLRGGPPRL
ncbi:MAG: hypothetical protein ABIR54_10280 [Burkholderiaceae bacterium]|jgi:hypothetical protein